MTKKVVVGGLEKYKGSDSLIRFYEDGHINVNKPETKQLCSTGLRLPSSFSPVEADQIVCRVRRRSLVKMSSIVYAVMPTFYLEYTGDTIVETPYSTDIRLQVGIEPLFEDSSAVTSGARKVSAVTTINANTPEGYVVVEIDLEGEVIPVGQEYGIWVAMDGENIPLIERTTGATTGQINEVYTNWYTGANYIDSGYIENTTSVFVNPLGSRYPTVTPVALMTTSDFKQAPSWGIVGDSIAYGVYDLKGPNGEQHGDSDGNVGWCDRLIGGKFKFPYVNVSRGTDSMIYAKDNFTRRSEILAYCNLDHVLFEYGVNDVFWGNTFENMEADRDSLIAVMRQYIPAVPLTGTTITPIARTSDDWQTVANQEKLVTSSGDSSMRGQYNNSMRSGGMDSVFADWLEIAGVVEYGYLTNESLWNSGTSGQVPKTYTEDGLHPTWDGGELIVNSVTEVIQTIVEEFEMTLKIPPLTTTEYYALGDSEHGLVVGSSGVASLKIRDIDGNDRYYSYQDNISDNIERKISFVNTRDTVIGYIDEVEKFSYSIGYEAVGVNLLFASLNLSNRAKGDLYSFRVHGDYFDMSEFFGVEDLTSSGTTTATLNGATWWKSGVDENYITNDLFKATLIDPPTTAYDAVVTDAEYIPQDASYWNPYNLYPEFPFSVTLQSNSKVYSKFNNMKLNLNLSL